QLLLFCIWLAQDNALKHDFGAAADYYRSIYMVFSVSHALRYVQLKEADADPPSRELPKQQAVLKAYYDSFPDIDTVTNVTNPDIKKAEEFTRSILNIKPSGDVSNRDTACHIISKLLGDSGQQCLFFDSANGINLHDASGNLTDIGSEEKIFVLKLRSSQGLGGDMTRKTFEDDVKLAEILMDCVKQNRHHPILEDIRNQLAAAHEVTKDRIVIKAVYAGSCSIVYTVLDLTPSALEKLVDVSEKLKKQFGKFLSAKVHPLLYRPSFDIACFDERGNRTFSSTPNTHQIGPSGRTKIYTEAAGWTRYGLKVLSKYKNDDWLHPFQHCNNWYRAFHGTGNAKAVDFGKTDENIEQKAAPIDAIANIYNTGFRPARVAACGPGVYCSPNPAWLEGTYAGAVEIDTVKGKKSFKCMIQVAVNPDGVKCATNEIWVVAKSEDIRPYGILIKEA
ncbi:unnamed protein product, partial [Rotaria socialis]